MTMSDTIRDTFELTEAVKPQGNVLPNVRLIGLTSRNGRRYRESAIERAVPLYEGATIYVNHLQPGEKRSRRIEESLGFVRGVRFVPGEGNRGEAVLNEAHPLYESIKWAAEHAPHTLGFSHDAAGRLVREGGESWVEEIASVESVDLVTKPATTNGLFEEVDPTEPQGPEGQEEDMKLTEATLEALKTSRPDLYREIRESFKQEQNVDALREELDAVKADKQKLAEELDRLKAKEAAVARAKVVDAAIAESKLPADAVSELFREQLIAEDDAERRKALLEDRVSLWRQSTGSAPKSRERAPFTEDEDNKDKAGDKAAIREGIVAGLLG